jgi:hypothetical protein
MSRLKSIIPRSTGELPLFQELMSYVCFGVASDEPGHLIGNTDGIPENTVNNFKGRSVLAAHGVYDEEEVT